MRSSWAPRRTAFACAAVFAACLSLCVVAKDYIDDSPEGEPNDWNGTGNNDTMEGFGGNDILDGRNGRDTLNGGDDQDTIKGGEDDDSMMGGEDDDTFIWDAGDAEATNEGDETADGGPGSDTACFNYDLEGRICRIDNTTFMVIDPGGKGSKRPPGGKIFLYQFDVIVSKLPDGTEIQYDLDQIPPCQQ